MRESERGREREREGGRVRERERDADKCSDGLEMMMIKTYATCEKYVV